MLAGFCCVIKAFAKPFCRNECRLIGVAPENVSEPKAVPAESMFVNLTDLLSNLVFTTLTPT